jgi:hypothetical protein
VDADHREGLALDIAVYHLLRNGGQHNIPLLPIDSFTNTNHLT